MTESTYLPERQSEYWSSRGIEDFFLDSGFQMYSFPLSQLSESLVPADFLFVDPENCKLFGLQYKARYHNGFDHWRLSRRQHELAQSFSWIYYALSDMQRPEQHRSALHYVRFLAPDFDYQRRLPFKGTPPYARWAAFYEGLRSCKFGLRVRSTEDLIRALSPPDDSPVGVVTELRELAPDVLAVNLEAKRLLRYSPELAPRQGFDGADG